ncbi:MAG: hypothetical protein ABEJ64_04235 [Candidatus Nanohaloarchaea archaeon]
MARGTEVPTFPVMILIGLTVFGLMFIVSEGGVDVGGKAKADSMVYTSHSFGKVGSANQDFRTIRFDDFNVGELRGDVQAYSARKTSISNSLLSGSRIEVNYNATQPRTGKVTFEVLGRNGPGAVFVKANGQQVFRKHLVATGTPEIEIPSSALEPGMNRIVIGATQGGMISSTKYSIEDVEVTVNDRKFHDWSDSFQVYDYELQDFVSAQLTFSVRDSVKTSPLEIFVNGNRIYSRPQVRISPETVEIRPGPTDLHPGYNSIRFETDGQAKYEIGSPQLTVRYLGNTERRTLRVDFGINRTGLGFARRDDTEERISFQYQRLLPSPRPMVIELNNNTHRLSPRNGKNDIEIDASELERSNQLTVRSNATYQLNNLRVMSEKVEE